MKILIINGPNLNMLGNREENIYGNLTYNEMNHELKKYYENLDFFQSNHEGLIIDEIQKVVKSDEYGGVIINAAAYTHTSIAIRDALLMVNIPLVEVHLSDINNREDFRKINYIKDICSETFMGHGIDSYKDAIDWLSKV
jgi:3-dehydroquinate dehydratase-2